MKWAVKSDSLDINFMKLCVINVKKNLDRQFTKYPFIGCILYSGIYHIYEY